MNDNEYWINTLNSKCREIIKGDKLLGHKNLEDKNKTWTELLNLSNEDKIQLIKTARSSIFDTDTEIEKAYENQRLSKETEYLKNGEKLDTSDKEDFYEGGIEYYRYLENKD